MTKPVREFSANEGDNSIGLAGPDAIEGDLDTIMRMFDPLTTHEDGSPGGIGAENIQDGAGTDNMIGDKTINQAITDEYSNTGKLTKLLSWLAKSIKSLKGTVNWYDTPADSMNNMHNRIAENLQSISENAQSLLMHKDSSDHDTRYHTKSGLLAGALDERYHTKDQLTSGALDERYYNKDQLEGFLGGGETEIVEEVFTIVSPDNANGTFTYNDGTSDIIGVMDGQGHIVFTLQKSSYSVGMNRMEAILDDTTRKSVVSGGLVEVSGNEVALVDPPPAGTEVTFRYFTRVATAAEYNIKLSELEPLLNNGRTMWFKELSYVAGVRNIIIIPEDSGGYVGEIHPKTNADQVVETSSNKVMTAEERTKLEGIQAGAQVNSVTSVAGKSGAVALTKADVGLGSVDNAKQMPIAGGTFTGMAKAQNNTSYTTGQIRNIFASTADPTSADGEDGDVWIKYE